MVNNVPNSENGKKKGKTRKYKNNSNHRQRIVNGYKAKNRPWLAFIQITRATCGGALINKK